MSWFPIVAEFSWCSSVCTFYWFKASYEYFESHFIYLEMYAHWINLCFISKWQNFWGITNWGQEYKKIKLNIDGKTKVEINKILKKYELDDRNLRFEVYGDENSLRSLDLDIFKSKNIDAKKMYSKKFEEDVKKVEIKEPVKKYDSKNILVSLKEFCDLKDYDFNKGSEIIKNFIKNG